MFRKKMSAFWFHDGTSSFESINTFQDDTAAK